MGRCPSLEPMRRIALVLVAIWIAGCAAYQNQEKFRAELTCGLSVEEVRAFAENSHARHIACSRPGGKALTCGVEWGRKGYSCEFDSNGNLVSYRHFLLKPLTVLEFSEVEVLCSRPSSADSPQEEHAN